MLRLPLLDYQSERHCSKTVSVDYGTQNPLDYQSERHCSKTKGIDDNFVD